MERYELLMWGLRAIWLAFVFALGACAGSLINVLVYRMPKGISVVWPPSRCPSCNTRLTWRENIPILGWLLLRGRCRFCRAKISAEYPIVEAAVAALFSLFVVIWYMLPANAVWLGVPWGAMKPDWAHNDPGATWPTFAVLLMLLGSLTAVTLVDAKTYTIPLPIVWAPVVFAALVHPVHAAVVGMQPHRADDYFWAIPTPSPLNWPVIWASVGAVAGLALSNLLLLAGLLRHSFADYDEWERAHRANKPDADVVLVVGEPGGPAAAPVAPEADPAPAGPAEAQGTPELWMEYPHARREMLKELAFLAPCLALGLVGWYFGQWFGGPWRVSEMTGMIVPASAAPLWLTVLSGVLLGYLIGGGLVWAVRIFGSLGFGREAMGLGDVHLMAAVGACIGWIDSSLAFFGAAFVALAWYMVAWLSGGKLRRMMPYGPFLAIATVLVLLSKPLIEWALSLLLRYPVNLP